MWPYSLRPKTPSEEPPVYEPPQPVGVADFKAFRDVGETFNYLGRECVVTSHKTMVSGGIASGFIPELRADYCDKDGVIRRISFLAKDLPLLIKQNGGK